MSFRRTIIVAILMALLTVLTLPLISGCDSTPPAPDFNNPFDPNGPNEGDPFDLKATLGDTNISLIWNNVDGYELVSYEVMHSLNFFDDFFSIGTVEVSAQPVATFTYNDPDPTENHYFKIQAYDSQGNFTLTSNIVPTSITTPARVVINDGGTQVASRFITIRMNVTSGDSLRISQTGLPESEMVIAADETGAPVSLPWDLGAVSSNDTILTINVVVQNSNSLGDTNQVDLDINFSPTMGLAQGGTSVADLNPPMTIKTDGVVSMRFADTLENLESASWVDPVPVYSGYSLNDSANPQSIHGEFLGDFGFTKQRILNVTPDLLDEVTFQLNLPPDHITDISSVEALCTANATLMRFSESYDFSTIPWIAYSDTTTIELSPEPGEKVIYAQFRNDFAESAFLTDYVIHIVQAVEVSITAPSENDIVFGDTTLRVQGHATSPSGIAPVDSVKFDGGDGFMMATGTEDWSFMWEIPRFDIDTDLVVRARAWSGGDSITTSMNLTVSQLMVGFNSPADGDTITAGTDVEISGFATPAVSGPGIDIVTVDIDGSMDVAEGTEAWVYDWHVGDVEEITEVVLVVSGFAYNMQHSTSITLIIRP